MFAALDPTEAVNTLSSTVLGAGFVILLFTCGFLLNKLLKSYDEKANVLREVLTAIDGNKELVNSVTNLIQLQNDRTRRR